ncbi:UbiX family flavin prenyltransferase [Candidatus Rariloculus sp.]|uniref:UbiX family flavin prenyltransferase n=1 Tax=Candidatus Rariloculus sp. TaxID=3101265 RepID=UPI003D0F2A68
MVDQAKVDGQVTRRIVTAITGASGSIYGVRLLEALSRQPDVETHLVVSRAGLLNVSVELDMGRAQLESLADVVHSDRDIGASVASGSFRTDGMIIAPCSTKSLAAIATGVTDTLVTRAADVALKERRRVVLMVRESPLHLVHLRNMTTVTEMGGIVFPPVPAFYANLESIDAMVDQTVGRVLDLFGIDSPLLRRWEGLREREGTG